MNIAKKINIKEGEKVLATIFPYALTYAWRFVVGVLFLVVTSFFMFRLFFYGWWGDIIYGLGMCFGFYIIIHAGFLSKKNILVLTSVRVVDIHRLGWFDEIISSISYLDVKDVAVRKKGLWQSMCNVGGISITTKSDRFVVEFLNIKNPTAIQSMIADMGQQYRQDIKLANNQVIYNNFVKIISSLPDGELREVQRLIEQQIGKNV